MTPSCQLEHTPAWYDRGRMPLLYACQLVKGRGVVLACPLGPVAGIGPVGTDSEVSMKYQRPSRRIEILRHLVEPNQAYIAWWGTFDLCNHLLITRKTDGQVVGVWPVDVEWYQRQTWESWQGVVMAFVKKVAAADQKTAGVPSPEGDKWVRAYPALWEYLTLTEYEDKTTRVTSTLLVFIEEGVVKACLNDRDASRTLWVSGPSVPDTLKALDALLRAGEGEWRSSKPWTPGKRQKRS